MSFTDRGHECESFSHKSSEKMNCNQISTFQSGSEENYYTDEDGISEESLSDSIAKLKTIAIKKNHMNSRIKKQFAKNQSCRLNAPLRYRKYGRFRPKNEPRKITRRKNTEKFQVKISYLEKPTEIPKKGKRCHFGGKARGKPPEEEDDVDSTGKHDSDDESDNCYFSRISLGYFQKFRDKSGASTSYELEKNQENPFSLHSNEEKREEISEDKELLELQRWGMTALVSSFNKESKKLNRTDDYYPDAF